MKSVLFVCAGNTCRSAMAEAILRHMLAKAGVSGVGVFSRGVAAHIGEPMTELAQESLAAQAIEGSRHRAMALTAADLERADLVLVMDDSQVRAIRAQFPDLAPAKMHLLKEYVGEDMPGQREIADPYGGSPDDYEKCRMEIQDSLLGLFPKLKML